MKKMAALFITGMISVAVCAAPIKVPTVKIKPTGYTFDGQTLYIQADLSTQVIDTSGDEYGTPLSTQGCAYANTYYGGYAFEVAVPAAPTEFDLLRMKSSIAALMTAIAGDKLIAIGRNVSPGQGGCIVESVTVVE